MKRFVIAAALAAVLALGSADRASAQVVYGYNTYTVNPYNGTRVNNQTLVTPFAVQQQQTYYNPYYGYGGQRAAYQNVYGTTYTQGYGVNPYGRGYQYGAYQPGFGMPPTAGYYYGRRW